MPHIVGVDDLRDLGIGSKAKDGKWDGDRQEDQIEIWGLGLGRNVGEQEQREGGGQGRHADEGGDAKPPLERDVLGEGRLLLEF